MGNGLGVNGVMSSTWVELVCARVFLGGLGKVFLKEVVKVVLLWVKAGFPTERRVSKPVVNTEKFNLWRGTRPGAARGVGFFHGFFWCRLVHVKGHVEHFGAVGDRLVVLAVVSLALERAFNVGAGRVGLGLGETELKDFEFPEVFWVHAALSAFVEDVVYGVVLFQRGWAFTNTAFGLAGFGTYHACKRGNGNDKFHHVYDMFCVLED
jgi:hypothetical protein